MQSTSRSHEGRPLSSPERRRARGQLRVAEAVVAKSAWIDAATWAKQGNDKGDNSDNNNDNNRYQDGEDWTQNPWEDMGVEIDESWMDRMRRNGVT